MKRTVLALAFALIAAGCSGGETNPGGTCTYDGATYTEFIKCPSSTVCCPTYDVCQEALGGSWNCAQG